MAKPKNTLQYLKDKLSLGRSQAKDRDISIYSDETVEEPPIPSSLLEPQAEVDRLGISLERRRIWFEDATEGAMKSLFDGYRLEIGLGLLEEQKKLPFSYPLAFRPQRLEGSWSESYTSIDAYAEHLEARYALHIYEDSLSLLLTALHSVSDELDERKSLNETEVAFFKGEAKQRFSELLLKDPGITPEEHNVLKAQARARLRRKQEDTHEDALIDFIQFRLDQDKVAGEAKSKFDPSIGYFGHRFSSITYRRISDFYRDSRATISIDDEASSLSHELLTEQGDFEPTVQLSDPEEELRAKFLRDVLNKSLGEKDRFIFNMKYKMEYSHENIAIELREKYDDEVDTKATNINYRLKKVHAEFISELSDAGLKNAKSIIEELLNI